MKDNAIKTGYTQIFIAGMFWGTTGLFMELLSNVGASNSLISILRVGTAAMIMGPVVWLKCGGIRAFFIDKKTLLFCAVMGFTAHTMFNICYTAAVGSVGIATAAVLLYSSLIFVCVLSRIVFGEPITPFKIAALIINFVGCTLTVTGGDLSTLSFILYGTVMGTLAALGYSTVPIIGKITTGKTHPYIITFYNFFFGSIFLIPFLLNTPLTYEPSRMEVIIFGFGAGLVSAVIPYMLFMSGLSKPIEASKVNVIASMEVVVASLIGVYMFSEFFNTWKLFGMLLVLVSIFVMNMSPREKAVLE